MSYVQACFTNPGEIPEGFGELDDGSCVVLILVLLQLSRLLPDHDIASGESLLVRETKGSGQVRYCQKCQRKKPDRAHHCTCPCQSLECAIALVCLFVCFSAYSKQAVHVDDVCLGWITTVLGCEAFTTVNAAAILNVPFHCVTNGQVNNCVGWANYKFFMLFLLWVSVLCLFGAISGA